ncbi:MAG: DMT family transporter [Bacteroidaceae bacterium]|nr:DMT family transporter [Bacteroidaceae bacterium]
MKSKLPYHILAISIIAIWGVTFINTKYLILNGLNPQEIFLLRFIIAYIGVWTFSPHKLFTDNWRDELTMVLLGISGGSLYFWAENTAIQYSLVNNVAFIVCNAPLITLFLGMAFSKEIRATKAIIAGSIISIWGVAMVIFNGSFILKLNPLGDFLALVAAASWAVYSLVMRNMTKRYNTTFLTRKVFFYGILTIIPVFIITPWQFPLSKLTEPVIWMNLVFLGVIAALICFVLWSIVIRELGALTSANYIYLSPVSTMIASAIFLQEPLTWISVVGSILILTGLFIVGFYSKRKKDENRSR